jgi:hypothetical protein
MQQQEAHQTNCMSALLLLLVVLFEAKPPGWPAIQTQMTVQRTWLRWRCSL